MREKAAAVSYSTGAAWNLTWQKNHPECTEKN